MSKPAPPSSTTQISQDEVRVWDLSTRMFHWLLVICIIAAWITIENRWIIAHVISGSILLTLLIFRIIWGVIGSTTARFSNFLTWPHKAMTYQIASLKHDSPRHTGHNPSGGWMVVGLISILLLQTLSGLFANNDLGFSGPLGDRVAKSVSDWFTGLHGMIFNLILVAVWLHLIAVFFYVLVKGDNLILPMINGKKKKSFTGPPAELSFVSQTKALIVFLLSAACVGTIYFI